MNKISIAIPLQQHSYNTAEVLIKNSLLDKYYTSVYFDQSRLYKLVGVFLDSDKRRRMENKHSVFLDSFVIKQNELLGLFFLFLVYYDKKYLFRPMVKNRLCKKFGQNVANKLINENAKTIIMYDTLAYDCFQVLNRKKSSIVKILDMASISALEINKIITNEFSVENKFKDSIKPLQKLYSLKNCRKYQQEINLADHILVASNYSKNTLINNGIDEKKIHYLPLGVDVKHFQNCSKIKKEKLSNEKLNFLFVGRVQSVKGIYYLLESFKRLYSKNVKLLVVGQIMCDKKQLSQYSFNVDFLGPKRKDEMVQIYNNADIYVLPSLFEGFSLSLFEALASGLPVIASKYSIAPDVITEYKEGFIIDPKNIDAITQKIEWFDENRNKLSQMSENSKKLANFFSWEKYEENLLKVIENIDDGTKEK